MMAPRLIWVDPESYVGGGGGSGVKFDNVLFCFVFCLFKSLT